jgi:electron transfer flavoprotein beta subunit
MKAKKKPLEERTIADLGIDAGEVGAGARKMQIIEITPPPQRQAGKIVEGESPEEKAAALAKMLREEAKVI